jgi:hypothetical protein
MRRAPPEFAKSRNERKKVEMRFAHLKTHHGFERMRLRGLSGARDEFHLAAVVQNLKTLANYIWRPAMNLPVCMRRLSVSGVQPGQLDAYAPLAIPARGEMETETP